MSAATASAREPERGVALLLVVWVMGLLAVIAVAVTADVRADLRLARNRVDAAQARALAEGGVWWGLDRLLNAQARKTLRLDGSPYPVTFDGHEVEVAIEDEGGKLDINAAPAEVLQRLFVVLGVQRDEAARLAGAIEEYRQSFSPQQPNVRPFAAVEEIRRVPGIGPQTYARVAHFLTVATGDVRVNPMTASREVLTALPGMTPRLIDDYFARRNAAFGQGLGPEELPTGDIINHLTWRAADMVTVRATARTAGGAAYIREAVISLAEKNRLYRVLAWRQGFTEADAE